MNNLNNLINYKYESDENKNNIKFTSIIILTYNQLLYTKLCIESIRKFAPKGRYEIIVIDNASTDETREWLSVQSDIISILNDKNEGFPRGCNQGIMIARGENILLLNNDTIVTPNFLYNLDYALWNNEKNGGVGCVSNRVANNQQIDVDYKDIESMLDFSKEFNQLNINKHEKRNRLIGFCMMIKKEVVASVGLLDERFYPGNWEDADYSLRIIKQGYNLIVCKDTFIHHFGSISFKGNKEKLEKNKHNLIIDNKKKFYEKWGLER